MQLFRYIYIYIIPSSDDKSRYNNKLCRYDDVEKAAETGWLSL